MSFDQMMGSLIAAINANTAALQAASNGHVAPQAAPVQMQQPAPQQGWAPPQQPATGMPPGPNYGPPPQQHPFTKQQDIYDYCKSVYDANNAMGPVLGQILQRLTPSGEASALQPTQYGEFYAAVEAARRG